LALLGPTAAGKSDVALALAATAGAPIISVDSMQVYRGMDIGTAKPSVSDRARVTHHMVDLVSPDREYSAAEFQQEARRIIDSGRYNTVIIVGGSGLHFRAIVDPHSFPPHDPSVRVEVEGLSDPVAELVAVDPGAGGVVDLANRRRVVRALEVHRLTGLTPTIRAASMEAAALRRYQSLYQFQAAGLDPGDGLESRIATRTESMREAGLLDEVAALAPSLGRTSRNAVGYRQLLHHLQGHLDLEAAWAAVHRATVGLARRQRTFFRRDPRIRWVEWADKVEARIDAVGREWGLN
jgi:tRNA dimethylallyltransferase